MKTISWIKAKAPMLIPINNIRPTNVFSNEKRKITFSPIMLVEGGDGYFYIVDGNHRFFYKLITEGHQGSLLARIISENEKDYIIGDPLPRFINEWIEGKISLIKLTELAKKAYKDIEKKVSALLNTHCCSERIINSKKQKVNNNNYKESLRYNALKISQSILKIIEGKTTVEKEIEVLGISNTDFSGFHKCFIDGAINAIQEKLKH